MAEKSQLYNWSQPEALPAYESVLTEQEFEQKATAVAEDSARNDHLLVSGPAERGKQRAGTYDEFEDWDDARFEAAAAAYRARQQAKQQQQQQQQQRPSEKQSASTSFSYNTPSTSSYRPPSPPRAASDYYVAPAFSGGQALAGQLPVMSSEESSNMRGLPQRPIDRPDPTGPPPSSPPPSLHQSAADSQYPPSFTSSMTTASPLGTPSQLETVHEVPRSQTPPARQNYGNAGPPPPPPPFRQIHHRHSEIPSSMINPRPEAHPAPQRRSDIPSSRHTESYAPPPVFQEGKGPILSLDEKKNYYGEQYSRARELYASATSKTAGPMVSLDLKKVGLNNDHSAARVEEGPVHSHTSFYSTSVSGYFDKRPLPQPKRQSMAPPAQQFGQQYNTYVPPSEPNSPLYGNANSNAYYMPANPNYPVPQQVQQQAPIHAGYYGQLPQQAPQMHQPHPGGFAGNQYQSNLHYPPAPQHSSAAQNYWPPNSNGWSPYGR
ncbi:hypothetical protein FRC19_006231 [Serendipita sp. 401]|nr:hypothetical protein FRC19_006231 [Serendipita sp. 401]